MPKRKKRKLDSDFFNESHENQTIFGPLLHAISLGETQIALKYIAQRKFINSKTLYGRTPLHLAADLNNKVVVTALIGANANIHALESNIYTPLNTAAASGNTEIMEILIAAGAHIDGKIPITDNIKPNAITWISPEKGYGTPLYHAAQAGKLEAVKLLTKHGANFDLPCKYILAWHTAVAIAAANHHYNIVTFLIGEGALSTRIIKDFFHADPLDLLVKYPFVEEAVNNGLLLRRLKMVQEVLKDILPTDLTNDLLGYMEKPVLNMPHRIPYEPVTYCRYSWEK